MVAKVTRPLRIAFLAPTPPPVMGPSIATTVVFAESPPEDIELYHLDTADRRSLATLGRIDLHNIWQALRMYLGLLWILLRRRPHVVYIPISQTRIGYLRDSVLILLAFVFRRRIVLHLRGGNFSEFLAGCGPLLRGFVKWTLRRAHGVIVLGDCLRAMFTPFVKPERIHVVPNGEDFPELSRTTRRYAGRTPSHVVFLGNMVPLKGAGDLLRAARDIDARFSFAGAWRSDEFRSWAEKFVVEHGMESRVRFHGTVDRPQKTRLLAEADLFVFPSSREGHPWVIVEALAAGLPIVSCDVGCIRECVFDRHNGRIVPPNSPELLRDTIRELLADPDRLQEMARHSRELYESRFTRSEFRGRLFEALRQSGGTPCA